jgi:hypothetical protein
MWACISYVPCGEEFRFSINAGNLTDDGYVLVYYADPWQGAASINPIGTFAVAGGAINESDVSIDLGMSLPSGNDENIVKDYYVTDGYAHPHGAKLWLVPSETYDDLTAGTWNRDGILFETDLITYVDADCGMYGVEI